MDGYFKLLFRTPKEKVPQIKNISKNTLATIQQIHINFQKLPAPRKPNDSLLAI